MRTSNTRPKTWSLLAAVATAAALLIGCGEPETADTDDERCVPGRIVDCPCTGDEPGVMTCDEEGYFGACECPEGQDPINDPQNQTEPECEDDTDCDGDQQCVDDQCVADDEEYLEFVVGVDSVSQLEDWDGFDGTADYGDDNPDGLDVWLGDGETLDRVLFDLTEAGDADLSINTGTEQTLPPDGASNWEIRNVGLRGLPRTLDPLYVLEVGVDEPEATGVIENVFADFREPTSEPSEADETGYDGGWAITTETHAGHIEVRNCFVAGTGGNAFRFGEDESADQGSVDWTHCYLRDNGISFYRTPLRDSDVRDSIAVLNDPDGTRGGNGLGDGALTGTRAFWHRGLGHQDGEPTEIDNLQIYFHPQTIRDDNGDPAPMSETGESPPVWGSLHLGDYGRLDVSGGSINSEWLDHQDLSDPNDAWAHEHNEGFEFNFLEDVTESEPDVSILDEGVPYTPEMAASGDRGMPPDPLAPAPGGGVPGDSSMNTSD